MKICWGFDFQPPLDQGWTGDLAFIARSTSIVRTGTHAHNLDFVGSPIKTPSVGNLASFYLGCGYYRKNTTAGGLFSIYDGGTQQITVTLESDGSYKIRRGGEGGTVLATSATGLAIANVWQHFQLGVTFGASGSVELRLNSVTIASASGVNTVASGNNYGNLAGFWASGYQTGLIDDVWISDAGFEGDCAVETIYPVADGDTNNFTANGAANRYQCVDETGDDNADTDYVFADTVNHLQLFEMGNLAASSGSVRLVRIHHVTRKDDAGSRQVKAVLKSGSNSERSAVALNTSYAVYSESLEQDPVDSNAWTIAKVNALQLGVKITA